MKNAKSNLESSFGSTPESIPISESTPRDHPRNHIRRFPCCGPRRECERGGGGQSKPFYPRSVQIVLRNPPLQGPDPEEIIGSRLSFLLQKPLTPEGSLKGSLKGSSYLSVERTLQNPFKTPSRTLRRHFQKASKSKMR